MSTVAERLADALGDRYRIERELGAGGMATVYLAQDLKHERQVAIKVLKPELAAVLGADRFVQEIKTTAALSHPNILPLFDSGEAGGFLYYVMPYLQGETIREKLSRETQFGIEEAVKITTEVAEALDYAHQNGVIHRDIKPENILLHAGRPMVMDFGIALAVSAAASGRMTETGLSLGTPQYMSPEQATADRDITARSDIYSLASVLYEMLTGEPPHMGSSAQQIIMKIVTEKAAPVTQLRKNTPPNVAAAVARALEKLPADRFASAADFAAALTNPAFTAGTMAAVQGAGSLRASRRVTVALTSACAVLLVVAAWGWLRPRAHPTVSREWIGLDEQTPDGVPSSFWYDNTAMAPDGSAIVFGHGAPNDSTPLWIKERGSAHAVPLQGTKGGSDPFFSPDGRWVGFATAKGLYRVPRGGGAPLLVSDSTVGLGGGNYSSAAWLDDGSIVFSNRARSALMRVSRDGSLRTAVTFADLGLPIYLSPLPGSRGVLLRRCAAAPCLQGSLEVVDLRHQTVHTLVRRAARGWYLNGGYLVYGGGDGTLLARRFDPSRLELSGAPVAALTGVETADGIPHALGTPNGTVLYASGGAGEASRKGELIEVDRSGQATVLDTTLVPARPAGVSVAPDGKRAALVQANDQGTDVYVEQLPNGPATRLTFGGNASRPSWSPDGRDVLYVSREAQGVLMRRSADGSGTPSAVLHDSRSVAEGLLSPDGAWLVWRTDVELAGRGDILARRTRGDSTTIPLAATQFDEVAPAVSPDSRWLAYSSTREHGTPEVFVRPLSATDQGRWQVSDDGGASPQWSPDGRELFFVAGRAMMAARVETKPVFRVSAVQRLFTIPPGWRRDGVHAMYAVLPDGHFLMKQYLTPSASTGAPPHLILIRNWLSEIGPLLEK